MNSIQSAGRTSPLGAHVVPGGVNFSIYSRSASGMELVFFDQEDDGVPSRKFRIDPASNRTDHYWHIFVPEVRPGQLYGYRASGTFDPARGLRFDPLKVLLDPYARAVVIPKNYSRDAATLPGDNAASAMKSVVVDVRAYDWEGDAPLHRPASQTIIYELHVRGFTRHPSSGVLEKNRGTYAGLVEKIPYLQELGITAVELLPVFQFDATHAPAGRVNYWGYDPVSFFAPHQGYCSRGDPPGAVNEFRDLVKALHRAGIEVILDVVFNHTAEGGHDGPTLSLRGLENDIYYLLGQDRSRYADYSGTGNTVNGNHPVTRRMILDSLRYWVDEMHVDGFRFDLAAVLERDRAGNPLPYPPVLWDIDSDPALAGTKLIAEAWDAAGLYEVGSFLGDNWREWNGRFRDDVRSFFRGDPGSVPLLADRLLGSPQIYDHKEQEAEESINFITCHDGFTLNDLVSYGEKHNETNGEGNRDGTNDNRSCNWGPEGRTGNSEVEQLRNRLVKNFLTVNLLSLGLPMILMGDEVRRSQEGNNNAWCQDNEISWLDWTLHARHADVLRFTRLLCAGRMLLDADLDEGYLTLHQLLAAAERSWHGVKLGQPDWSVTSHSIALLHEIPREHMSLYFILNAWREPLDFELPPAGAGKPWRRWIDTGLESPCDITAWKAAPVIPTPEWRLAAHSVAVLHTCG